MEKTNGNTSVNNSTIPTENIEGSDKTSNTANYDDNNKNNSNNNSKNVVQ